VNGSVLDFGLVLVGEVLGDVSFEGVVFSALVFSSFDGDVPVDGAGVVDVGVVAFGVVDGAGVVGVGVVVFGVGTVWL
jgi:hypothetical protein